MNEVHLLSINGIRVLTIEEAVSLYKDAWGVTDKEAFESIFNHTEFDNYPRAELYGSLMVVPQKVLEIF